MFKKKLESKSWYAYTVAICVGVILFVVLTNFSSLREGFWKFLGYFAPVLWGCAIAYLVNPLARLYDRSIFRGIRNGRAQVIASNTTAFLTVVLVIISVMLMLIPELVSSITQFVGNMDQYVDSMNRLLSRIGISSKDIGLSGWIDSSGVILHNVSDFITKNMDDILATSANAGKTALQWLIAFMLSIYLLANKNNLKAGLKRFLKALLSDSQFEKTKTYLRRSNYILNRFVVFNILDAVIVGTVNMIFMLIMGFPYAWLISVVVALTNLVPTFGPFVGGAIGMFVLVLVEPWYAVAFGIFTLILQLIDGYIIKPKLFGGSLGVPALWVLIAIVVSGKMFGVVGILLSVPLIAILSFTYNDYFMPWLESRPRKQEAAAEAAGDATASTASEPEATTSESADAPAATEESEPEKEPVSE